MNVTGRPVRDGYLCAMSATRSKFHSIFRYKCPHCHEGDFFVDNNPYNLAKAGDVLERCPVCQRKFTPEPGFYYGAMYVSYALTVAVFVTVYVAINVLFPEAATWVTVTAVLTALVVLAPWLYAISKTIWANLFLSYKGVQPTEQEKRVAAGGSARQGA